jgi:hypothetical protein
MPPAGCVLAWTKSRSGRCRRYLCDNSSASCIVIVHVTIVSTGSETFIEPIMVNTRIINTNSDRYVREADVY